jgi:hypothetical protein
MFLNIKSLNYVSYISVRIVPLDQLSGSPADTKSVSFRAYQPMLWAPLSDQMMELQNTWLVFVFVA